MKNRRLPTLDRLQFEAADFAHIVTLENLTIGRKFSSPDSGPNDFVFFTNLTLWTAGQVCVRREPTSSETE